MTQSVALVVEDDDDVREVASAMLEGTGCKVVAVRTAKAAIAALEWLRPDLILTDLSTPGGVTGCELAAQAKRVMPDIRVICSSGKAGCDEPRCDRFLRKPYSLGELAAACGSVIAPPRVL